MAEKKKAIETGLRGAPVKLGQIGHVSHTTVYTVPGFQVEIAKAKQASYLQIALFKDASAFLITIRLIILSLIN